MSELSSAETDAEQALNEVRQACDAANSQPLSPAASDEDYAELGEVVEQVWGSSYYEQF